ncbi:hypothetical protein ACFLXJ_03200 [Chloroflexota bacterium]
MKFLKGLVLTVLSLLLFLSLAMFGTVFTLKNTILSPDFVVTQVNRLDVSTLARELTEEQMSGQTSPEALLLEEALYETIADNEPWLKEQVNAGVYSFYDYLLGKSERLVLVISLEQLKENLRDNLWQLFQENLESLPPEVTAAPPAVLEQYFDEFYQQFAGEIPSEFEVDESDIPPDIMTQLNLVRDNISYVQTAYYALIGLMVLLVLLIILVHRNVKGPTRELGITFFIYGALEYASVWATHNFLPGNLPLEDIPPSLQYWLTMLIGDLVAPMKTLGIGLMVGGVVLIIISIVYPRLRRKKEEEPIAEEATITE